MACLVDCTIPQAQGDLLDALLASCQKSALNPPLPSYGRKLEPYFQDYQQGPVVLPGKKALPNKVKNAAKAKTLPPAVVRAAIDSAKATSTKAPKMPEKKLPASPAPKAATKAASIDDLFAWAGPGFCVAPPPEQLPAPTSFLLG